MPEFLQSKQPLAAIDQVITAARERLVLVSPYLKISKLVWRALADAGHRGVQITVVTREDANNHGAEEELLKLPGVSVFRVERLHAKCYYNEHTLVLTSLNLLEASEQNYEMGVRFTSAEPVYEEAVRDVGSLIRHGTPLARPAKDQPVRARVAAAQVSQREVSKAPPKKGSCIRCGAEVRRNPDAPLCRDCWNTWVVFSNPEYQERFCHVCGREAKTTMNHPRCRSCFTAAARA